MASFLGVDIGEKRIGISLCDANAPFPAPLTTLEASPHLAQEFSSLLHKHHVQAVVIGYPRNQQGEPTAQTARVEHIVKLLKIPHSVSVYWQDESLTSHKAEEELNRRKKPYAKGDIDALAATFILEDFVKTQLPYLQADHAADPSSAQSEDKTTPKKTKKKSGGHKHKKRSKLKLFAAASLFLITIFSLVSIAWYKSSVAALSDEPSYQVITIKPGSGTQVIAAELEQKQLIKSATAFTMYTRLNKPSPLQAGSYRVSSHQSVKEIIDIIAGGKITTVNILIAPGLRLDEIIDKLEKAGYAETDVRNALNTVRDHPMLSNVPKNVRLEGYLFPDTYKVGPDTSAEALLRLILTTFRDKISPNITDGLRRQGLSFDQAVILASIVQKEEPNPEVQKTIAQVFIKRYKEGMPLGADPTFKYAAAQFGDVNSPDSNSPYNTRKIVGLPPTAISNFNISALEAVANPAPTTYVYFVHGDDGKAHFSNTLQEHQANTQRYCTVACR